MWRKRALYFLIWSYISVPCYKSTEDYKTSVISFFTSRGRRFFTKSTKHDNISVQIDLCFAVTLPNQREEEGIGRTRDWKESFFNLSSCHYHHFVCNSRIKKKFLMRIWRCKITLNVYIIIYPLRFISRSRWNTMKLFRWILCFIIFLRSEMHFP